MAEELITLPGGRKLTINPNTFTATYVTTDVSYPAGDPCLEVPYDSTGLGLPAASYPELQGDCAPFPIPPIPVPPPIYKSAPNTGGGGG